MAGEAAAGRRRESRRERAQHEAEFGRIVAFSDGVFAIAITLLVLNLEVPRVAEGDSAGLARGLADLSPHLFAYGLSFAVVGRFWLVHHRFFATLGGFDAVLMVGNLALLALIVLVPFSSDLLGTYGEIGAGVMAYATVVGLAGTLNWLMARYALRHHLVRPEDRPRTEPFGAPAALAIPGAFLVSIPIALLSPAVAQLAWLGALFGVRRQRGAARS